VAEREIAELGNYVSRDADQIRALVLSIGSVAAQLAKAPPELKKRLYEELGVAVVYEPGSDVVRITAEPRVGVVRVGGAS